MFGLFHKLQQNTKHARLKAKLDTWPSMRQGLACLPRVAAAITLEYAGAGNITPSPLAVPAPHTSQASGMGLAPLSVCVCLYVLFS